MGGREVKEDDMRWVTLHACVQALLELRWLVKALLPTGAVTDHIVHRSGGGWWCSGGVVNKLLRHTHTIR